MTRRHEKAMHEAVRLVIGAWETVAEAAKEVHRTI